MTQTADAAVNAALTAHRQGDLANAERNYVSALERNSDHPVALHLLGVIRYQQERHDEAKALISKSLKISPGDPMAMNNLANVHQALGEHEVAAGLLTDVLDKQPGAPQILANRGNAYREMGQLQPAIADYLAALRTEPRLVEASRNLGLSYMEEGHWVEAKRALEHSVKLAPNSPESRLALANCYSEIGHKLDARQQYEAAIALKPDVAAVHYFLGNTLRDLGEIEGAAAEYRRSIALDPASALAWRGLAGVVRFKTRTGEVDQMEAAYKAAETDASRMYLAYGLGKVHEDLGEYPEAFEHFKAANVAHRASFDYTITDDSKFLSDISAIFTAEFLSQNAGHGDPSEKPLFIVGMPRSGTSLTEQILASHSQVYGAGEIDNLARSINSVFPMVDGQDYTAALADAAPEDFGRIAAAYLNDITKIAGPNMPRIADKMPTNFINIGIIALTFPNARIVHCRRDPRDVCLSIYKNHFTAKGHHYACDLDELGKRYMDYHNLMQHWQRVLRGRIIEVQYEDLVSDQEAQTRRLLEACGLSFEEACLFPQKTKRAVTTISAAQVREPVHKKSIAAWARYETELEPLIAALAPALKEFT